MMPAKLAESALLVQLAYRVFRKYGRDLPDGGMFRGWAWIPFELGRLQYLVAFRDADRRRVLVLPGTNEPADWWAVNLRCRWKRSNVGRWHEGFFDQALALDAASATFGGFDNLEIVGHSMGAAVGGCYAGLIAAMEPGAIRSIHLLETPRFCDDAAAAWLGEEYADQVDGGDVLRVRMGVDPVVDLPPWMCAPFPETVISSTGEITARPNRVAELCRALRRRGLQTIQHHSIDALVAWAMRQNEPCHDCLTPRGLGDHSACLVDMPPVVEGVAA